MDLSADLEAASLPVQILIGPRQCGKGSFFRRLMGDRFRETTLDDLRTRQLAERDPALFFARKPIRLSQNLTRALQTARSITTAVDRCRKRGQKVAQAHFRYMNPMPSNTAAVLKKYPKILVPELNTGQLAWLLRAKYLAPAEGLCKVQGRPFLISEIEAAIGAALGV